MKKESRDRAKCNGTVRVGYSMTVLSRQGIIFKRRVFFRNEVRSI